MNLGNAQFCRRALLLAVICLFGATVFAQDKSENRNQSREFCSSTYNYYGNGASFNEVRETTLPAGSDLTVDGARNGGISVRGGDRSDVLVRACIQARGGTDEAARQLARSIRIETGSVVRAETSADESNWAVSYEVLVPRRMNLKLTTNNGGIAINAVEGMLEFAAHNGGVSLSEVAGDVRGRTTNGGVAVKLSGAGWRGAGLDVETSNGGVHLSLPENYAAHVETGTVNGGFISEIAGLDVERKERMRGRRISADLNGGGAPVRVVTTNGGVKISAR